MSRKTSISKLAQVKLKYAVDSGKIIKPDGCENCGRPGVMLHGHHEDYSRPLDVTWLCPSCHSILRRSKTYKCANRNPLGLYIEEINETPCGWAKRHGFPLPVITRFIKGERGVSFVTAHKIIGATSGALCWDDFLQPANLGTLRLRPRGRCVQNRFLDLVNTRMVPA